MKEVFWIIFKLRVEKVLECRQRSDRCWPTALPSHFILLVVDVPQTFAHL